MENKHKKTGSKTLSLLRSRFFKLVYLIIGLLLLILFYINYRNTRRNILHDFEQEFQIQVNSLDSTLQNTVDHVYSMGDLASTYLSEESPWEYPTEILRSNSVYIGERSTHLYRRGAQIYHHKIDSAIFVQDPIPQASPQYGRYFNLALSLQDMQQAEHHRNPSITLSYFFGKRDYFSQIYPYIPIEEIILHYNDCRDMMDHGYEIFSELAPPEFNPERTHFWTRTYLDTTQQGMMVSCGLPVYQDDNYLGLVGIDVVLDFLSQYTEPVYRLPGRVLLVSPYDQIITQTGEIYGSESEIKSFSGEYPGSTILSSEQRQEELENGTILFRRDLQNAPWSVIYVSSRRIIQRTMAEDQQTMVILGIFLLLFLPLSYLVINKKFIQPGIRADQDLRDLNKNLDSIVVERTAELEEKNKELENYLYVASHDLRAPLVNIQGFSLRFQRQTEKILELLETSTDEKINHEIEKLKSTDIPKTLQFIQTNVTKMDALLNGLLTISRTGRTQMTWIEISGKKLLSNVLDSFEHQLSDLNAKVQLEDLPSIKGDWDLLNQLFSNIISNAIKYHSEQRPLEISIRGEEKDNWQSFIIEDNGIGIGPQHIERIFDVFFRVDFSKPDSGDGIGLSIVKRIIEMHHGRIEVESELDRGTLLRVSFSQHAYDIQNGRSKHEEQ